MRTAAESFAESETAKREDGDKIDGREAALRCGLRFSADDGW